MSLLDNMQLKHKLFLPIGMAVAGLVIVGLMSYQTIETIRINGDMDHALQLNDQVQAEFTTPKLNILKTRILVYQLILAQDRDTELRLAQQVQEQRQLYEEKQKEFAAKLPAGDLKDLITQRARAAAMDYFDVTQQQFVPALLNGNKNEAAKLVPVLRDKYIASESTIEEVRKLAEESNRDAKTKAGQIVSSRTTILLAVGVIVIVGVSFFGIILVHSITSGTGKMVGFIQEIAANNLAIDDIDISAQDEIGQAMQRSEQNEEQSAGDVQSIAGTAEHVASASEEISSSASQQVARAPKRRTIRPPRSPPPCRRCPPPFCKSRRTPTRPPRPPALLRRGGNFAASHSSYAGARTDSACYPLLPARLARVRSGMEIAGACNTSRTLISNISAENGLGK